METGLCKKRIIYLTKGDTIKLEFICHSFVLRGGGGGGIYLFYYVVNFVNKCALHSKLNFSLVCEMFGKQNEFWF